MIKKQEFLERNEQIITKELRSSLSYIAPRLETDGFFKSEIRCSCVPGVVIEVQRLLQKHLYDHGWMAEVSFSVDMSGPKLDIKVY